MNKYISIFCFLFMISVINIGCDLFSNDPFNRGHPNLVDPLYGGGEEPEKTYTDSITSLMWVKDGNSAGCNNGKTLTWEKALTFCEGLDYAGYSDWRLPNVRELESIIDAERSFPAINTTNFPNTKNRYYWTSTTYVPLDGGAWSVKFSTGGVRGYTKQSYNYVRPVRGSPAESFPDTGQEQSYTTTFGEDHDYQPSASQPSYTDNGDGTITDNITGLMWVKDGNSAGCNNGAGLQWDPALIFCGGLDYAGYSDWRLPDRRELMSIVDYGEFSPAINTTYFTNIQNSSYWTATAYVPDRSDTWYVYFVNGYVLYANKITYYNYVRPVRGGP